MYRYCFILGAALLCAVIPSLRADVLTLSNGDRLTGTYMGEEDGEVIFDSEFLGEVRLAADLVTVRVDESEVIDPIEPVETVGEGEPIDAAGPPEEIVEAEIEVEASPLEKLGLPQKLSPFPHWNRFWEDNIFFRTLGRYYPLMHWTNKLELGLNMSFAERDTETWLLRIQTEREKGRFKYLFAGSYDFAEATDATGETVPLRDRLEARAQIEYNLDEQRSFFVQSRSRYNRDLVSSVREVEENLGVGYRLLDSSVLQSSIVPSLGVGYQEIGEEEGVAGIRASIFQDFRLQLTERVQFKEEGNLSYAPTDEDENAYFASVRSEIQTMLNARMSLNLRHEYQWDERIQPPASRTTQTITVSIGAEF